MTNYAGIDYGMGKTNINPNTGIRYGVISSNDCNDFIYEDFESDYGDPGCPVCLGKVVEFDSDKHSEGYTRYSEYGCDDYACEECKKLISSEDAFPEEPVAQIMDKGGYKASLDGHNDIFITESPYFTYVAFCSPCAPGAGDLSSPFILDEKYKKTVQFLKEQGLNDLIGKYYNDLASRAGFPKTYCFGHDMFNKDCAPYPVFDIKTGEFIPCK